MRDAPHTNAANETRCVARHGCAPPGIDHRLRSSRRHRSGETKPHDDQLHRPRFACRSNNALTGRFRHHGWQFCGSIPANAVLNCTDRTSNASIRLIPICRVRQHDSGENFERIHPCRIDSHSPGIVTVTESGKRPHAVRIPDLRWQFLAERADQRWPARLAYPTDPSICNSISRFISTAYSIGSSFTSGSMKPVTIIDDASASLRPRLIR